MRNDETHATDIGREWRVATAVGLEGKQETERYEFDDGIYMYMMINQQRVIIYDF
jgi:hypothetical protein